MSFSGLAVHRTETPDPARSATTPFTRGITDAASLKRAIDERMLRARTLLDAMLTVKGPRTVANTLAPYDELLEELNTASGQLEIMMDLHPDAGVRQAADDLDRAVSALLDEILRYALAALGSAEV